MTKVAKYSLLAKNRRASFDYDIDRRLIAGIVLTGPETKSVRNRSVSLKGSFANFRNGELWLNNMHISKYPYAKFAADYDPSRPRKLLLHKNELERLMADKQNGMQIVVLSVGVSGKHIKAELGVGRSRKKYDKRQAIKSRNQAREAQKAKSKINYR